MRQLHQQRRICFNLKQSRSNVGDVVVEDDDLFGDAVNVAARLQEVSVPNGIAISDGAHRELRGRLDIIFEDAGDKMMKNIAEPVHTWLWPAKDASRVNRIMRFDAFSLDLDAHSITVGDEAVHVEPQVYEIAQPDIWKF